MELRQKQVNLARAAWQTNGGGTPPLPAGKSMTLNLPALDGEQWLALLAPALKQGRQRSGGRLQLPHYRGTDHAAAAVGRPGLA